MNTAPQTLAEMIAICRFNTTLPDFTEERFPTDPRRFTVDGLRTFDLHESPLLREYLRTYDRAQAPATTQIVVEIAKQGLRPATIEELLAFVSVTEATDRSFMLAALGTVSDGFAPWYKGHGDRHDLVLTEAGPDRRWKGVTRLLVAQAA